jgi:hypothetical protein
MREEENGVAGAALGVDEDGVPLPNEHGHRQFHDPLLVIGELLCVPCMETGFGLLFFFTFSIEK